MMLLQQAGMASLPLSSLSPDAFLGFLRSVEQLVLDEQLNPIVVYWSSQQAKRLLPKGQRYRELMRDTFCVSVFSEERADAADEWCFLVESQLLSLIVYGQQSGDQSAGTVFQCAASLSPDLVRQAFGKMLPVWQFIDLAEANRLEDARKNMPPAGTSNLMARRCRELWPVVKVPTREFARPGEPAALSAPPPLRPPAVSLPEISPCPGEAATVPTPEPDAGQEAPALPATPAPSRASRFMAFADSPLTAPADLVAPPDAIGARPSLLPAAQEIIRDIIGQLRHSDDTQTILQTSIEKLSLFMRAHRGLIWQVQDGELAVTHEYASNGYNCFAGNRLGSQDSTAILLEFLSRFPEESAAGVISVPDTHLDTDLHKKSPTLASLIELGDVRARLVAQLRCRGIFSGFLELQHCGQTRSWTDTDAHVLQSVAEMLSVVVQQSKDQSRIQSDAQEMKLINEIAGLFRESKGQRSHDVLVQSVALVASHLGFVRSQIYLFSPEDDLLVPQMAHGNAEPVALSVKDNPFVAVFESGRVRKINLEPSRKGDPYFKHDTALVVPLLSEGERLGVLGFWQRMPGRIELRQKDEDLVLNISGQLATFIRADQAIAQIRDDQARAALINRVVTEIRNSLKEVDQLLETLVEALQEYFLLGLCVVSLYDGHAQDFTKTKTAGALNEGASPLAPNFGEKLFLSLLDELKQGQVIFLGRGEIDEKLAERGIAVPEFARMATLVPLVHGGELRAALCMVSADRARPYPDKDLQMVCDVAERVGVVISHAQLYAQVEQQAVTDPMTGLFNRRYFNEQLSRELDRFQRHGHPFSYIIIDLDYLKRINDNLGHQFGDAAIKHIAAVLKRQVRDVDTAARYGGEEFVILLPVTDVKSARIAAERICNAIREKPVEGVGTVTASVGVSTFPTDATDRDSLTELADQALYLAKHRGRDQVCSVSEDLKPSLAKRGQEALEVQQEAMRARAAQYASIDLGLIAEHGVLGIMGSIVKLIEAKDAYDQSRSPRAADYATRLAQALHLSKEHTTIISLAAVLHNVGKLAVPEELLKKPGPLTPEERKIIEQSPEVGARILEPARHLHRVAAVIEAYHEHWDGTGYPKRLKGEEIPLESRIIALVDAYIAMTSDRPYRQALPPEQAIELIKQGAGKEWDPRLVKLFVSLMQRQSAGAKK